MHKPVRTVDPTAMPVTRERAKVHCRATDEEDELIDGYIAAAVDHIDGYAGILGFCLMSQTWRQDFDDLERLMRLPLGPIVGVPAVTVRNLAGQMSTISTSDYALLEDEIGPFIRFKDGVSFPQDLYQSKAVSVTFVAGYADEASVPKAIVQAILLIVGHWYENRTEVVTGTIATQIPMAAKALLGSKRRVGF